MRDQMRGEGRLVFAGLATFVVMGFGQALIGPTLPEVTRIFVLPDGQAAVLVSALWIGSALGVGLMYRFGSKALPRHALALLALGAVALALRPVWGVMLAGAMVFGIGFGMATAIFNPRFLKAFGARGASMLSLLNAAFAAGAIVAPLVFVAVGGASRIVFAMAVGLAYWSGFLPGKPTAARRRALRWPAPVFASIGRSWSLVPSASASRPA